MLTCASDSEISTDDEDDIPDEETFVDRLRALRDIVPPTTRTYISDKVDATTSVIKTGLFFSGSFLYVISTGALMLGVPWALAFAEEQQVIEMENEMKMRDQGAKDVRIIPGIAYNFLYTAWANNLKLDLR